MGSLFLGLELATDQLRASLIDESLELVSVECVDFDEDLGEYKTQGGIFTSPGEAYTTPVEMWVKALDVLLERLHRSIDIRRIKCIGGSAQHAFVWWKSPLPSLTNLNHTLALNTHLPRSAFSLPHTPVAQDSSAHPHAVALEALLGGPEKMAARVGSVADGSMLSAQLLKVRESEDVWMRTGKVQLASCFLASILTGRFVNMSETDASATGMWVHTTKEWDETVLEVVGGDVARKWIGPVDVAQSGDKPVGVVSRYLVERYGFDSRTMVTSFTSDSLATYLSLLPQVGDAVLQFGPMDLMMTPAVKYTPGTAYMLFPHPAQDAKDVQRRYIAVTSSRNADVPRALVRDMYTKSWSAFDRLVAIVPPGGSIGLDDKLFAFWLLQPGDFTSSYTNTNTHPNSTHQQPQIQQSPTQTPSRTIKGIFRFETGIKVNEFRDLRANPRCLLESQVLRMRVAWAGMRNNGLLSANNQIAAPLPLTTVNSSLGLPFDPYDTTTTTEQGMVGALPNKILATGAAANFPSVANLVGDVFNAPVFLPATQVGSAAAGSTINPEDGTSTPGGGGAHRNRPERGFPGRATLGSAYVARWIYSRAAENIETESLGSYEDDIRRLLAKKFTASGNVALRTSVNPSSASAVPQQLQAQNSSNFVQLRSSSLGNVFGNVEDDISSSGKLTPTSAYGNYDRARAMSIPVLSSTAYTAPDVQQPSTPTPLTPVSALPTADSELQLGWLKVAEPDVDAFMGYAALVPEFYRLEGLVGRGLV